MSMLLLLLVKATVVLVAGLGAAGSARRARASVRHLILAATCAALVALPVAAALGPLVSIDVPIVLPSRASDWLATPTPVIAAPPTNASAPSPAPAHVSDAARLPAISTVLLSAWAVGLLILGGSLLMSLWRLARLIRSGVPWLDGQPLVNDLTSSAGIHRAVTVVLHEDVASPLTVGLLRPIVVLPAAADTWSEADVRRALLHELEHVHRADWLVQLVARAVCIAYWFHPLAWMALRKLSLEAERACDDAVIRREERTEYADQLVSLARHVKNAPHHMAIAMASRSDLATRVSSLLDDRQRRGRAGLMPTVLVVVVTVFAVLAIAPVRAVERSQGSASRAPDRVPPTLIAAPWAPVVEALVGKSDEQPSQDRWGLALIEAAQRGDVNRMSPMLDAGIDVNSVVLGDGSPLIAAARGGHRPAVELLLDRGADINLGVRGDGNPLIMAARGGHFGVTELLLSRGADIDAAVDGDENALIQASGAGHLTVVQLLVGRGADVNARVWADRSPSGGEWRTPLSMAQRGRHAGVVAFLQSAGAVQD